MRLLTLILQERLESVKAGATATISGAVAMVPISQSAKKNQGVFLM